MKKIKLFSLLLFYSTCSLFAQRDWDNVPIPANPGAGNTWQLQEAPSDDFNYTFNTSNTRVNFGPPGQPPKWYNTYHDQPNGAPNTFQGPGPTIWTPNQISVQGGFLNIIASRVPGEVKRGFSGEQLYNFATRSGCMTNLNRVKYPVFVETRIQIMNSMLASDVWLLSPDDTEEIDIIEAYGGSGDDGRNAFFAERIHLSHHVFIRQPFTDYQPRDFNSFWRRQGISEWGGRTVNIGVYWVSPTRLEYYIDGQLQRIVDNNALQSRLINGQFEATYPAGVTSDQPGGQLLFETGARAGFQQMITAPNLQAAQAASNVSVIDPFNHLNNGRQFSKDMDIIINVEDQSFQADAGRSPTDTEISRRADHTMRVDWIRVYKPVSASGGGNPPVGTTNRTRSVTFNNSSSFAPAGSATPQFQPGQNVNLNLSYATGISNGNEEDLNYVAVQIRELDESGNEVATSPFTVAIPGSAANTGTTNFSYTIPASFDEAGTNPIPSSANLDAGHQILLLVFMSVNNDTGFADDNTLITYNISNPAPPTPPADNLPPQISFTNPSNGTNFTQEASIGVTVNASDTDGTISNVRLFYDGTLVRQENISPYNWGIDNGNSNDNLLNNVTAGSHTLQAIATDNDGVESSQTITINVANPAPPTPVTNIALNKTATQSSTLFELEASFAVDGNRNNFSHTAENGNTWVEIDLGGRFSINQVNIWNREDCCAERLSEYQLFISDQPFISTDIVTTANQTGVGVFFQSDVAERPTSVGMNFTGRYVRVQLTGIGILNIAEIEVFGTPVSGAKVLSLNDSLAPLNLYPNPVASGNAVTIENTTAGGALSIFDVSGRLITKINTQDQQTTAETINLSSGIYFIEINKKVKKLVVK
ncbi:galactose-binding domain-containing protein [Aquimarina agarivorans]|uniref:galactose-binding domain-containing protein n=1 Tax=Aquimarina agarivorans TaxID=980584 RepID=UPI00058E881B|nr:Ig-like domain-containing protein [Aquimarina agarivorans]